MYGFRGCLEPAWEVCYFAPLLGTLGYKSEPYLVFPQVLADLDQVRPFGSDMLSELPLPVSGREQIPIHETGALGHRGQVFRLGEGVDPTDIVPAGKPLSAAAQVPCAHVVTDTDAVRFIRLLNSSMPFVCATSRSCSPQERFTRSWS